MGGSLSLSSIKNTFYTENDLIGSSRAICQASCTSVQSSNVYFLNNVRTTDGIVFDNECQSNLSCVANQSMSSATQNLTNAVSNQKSTNPAYGFITASYENDNVFADITNRTTELINTTCSATVNNVQDDNVYFLTNDAISGVNSEGSSLSFTNGANSSATANCSLTNLSKILAYNQNQTSSDQTSTAANGFLVIIAIIVIGVIIAGIFGSIGGKKDKKDGESGSSLANSPIVQAALLSANKG